MYILGIHIGHESAAALLKNGNIIGAIQEERFDRIKNSSNFPTNAIEFLLEKANISPNDISNIVLPGKELGKELPFDVLKRRLGYKGQGIIFKLKLFFAYLLKSNSIRKNIYNIKDTENFITKHLKKIGFLSAEIKFLDHHLCHAASAYYSSPFENCLIVTQDGKGDGASGTIFIGEKGKLIEIARQKDIDSVGQLYAEITRFVGFKPNRHEGKITGLAAYGESKNIIDKFNLLIESNYPTLKRSNILSNQSGWKKSLSLSDKIKLYSSHPDILPYNISAFQFNYWLKLNFSHENRENLAAAIQTSVENWTVNLCGKHISKNLKDNSKNIVLAGGLFANVKINQRILEESGAENIFIQPAMGDSGLALGAAQFKWKDYDNRKQNKNIFNDSYLGKEYSNKDIEILLKNNKEKFSYKKYDNIENEIGNFLNQGLIVGNLQGRSEWGPRALGNRSILIRPTDKNINDIVNDRLYRSEFMPFAPSVLDYRASDYFKNYRENHIASEYMTITYDVFEEKVAEIQAVVHIDNTARPQIVKSSKNKRYYNIIKAYEKLSGIGCIVNTSFNLHEEPIVESPTDALRAFEQNAIDVLILNDYVVKIR